MRTVYPAMLTYQQLALLHNALTLAWLALPAAILALSIFRMWPWAVACLLLDVGVAWARSWTFREARQRHRARLRPRSWRRKLSQGGR